MYDDEFETKENKIWTKDKIEPQHIYNSYSLLDSVLATLKKLQNLFCFSRLIDSQV